MIKEYIIIPTNMIVKGTSMVWWMVGAEVNVMLVGWWREFHQSTEYFITGKLNNPIIPMIEDILLAFSKLTINFQVKIYAM